MSSDSVPNLASIKSIVTAKMNTRNDLRRDHLRISRRIEKHAEDLENLKILRELVQRIAGDAQQQVQEMVSRLISKALAAIFPEPYEFRLEFEDRRNQIECTMYFKKGDHTTSVDNGMGGGVRDVAAFSFKLIYLGLKGSRPCLIMDEPFRFVSVNLQERCSATLKWMADNANIQIIMVSHLPEIIKSADRIFECVQVNGRSIVKQLNE